MNAPNKKIYLAANRLLKMYRLLHPLTPFAEAESMAFATDIGFKDGSIELDQLVRLYTTDLLVPKLREDIKPNTLSQLGREFLQSLNSERAKDFLDKYYEHVYNEDRHLITCKLTEEDDMDWILASLDALKKDEDWVIDSSGGLSMTLYVRPLGSKRLPVGAFDLFDFDEEWQPLSLDESKLEPLFDHIRLPFTRKALWQVYLLYTSTDLIGHFGHGGYSSHRMVFDYSDLKKQSNLPEYDNSFAEFNPSDDDGQFNLNENKPLLKYLLGRDIYPSIITDTTYAMITHYWINDWKGLYKTHMIVKYDQYKQVITDWYRVNEKPLITYDCEVRF